MISLDQVELLEAKIESAVGKITQLQVENDALRNRVQELSNALSAKSEQLSLCEQKLNDSEKSQQLIESGILKALNRLNSIENSVLKANGSEPVKTIEQPVTPVVQAAPIPVVTPVAAVENEPDVTVEETVVEETEVVSEPETVIVSEPETVESDDVFGFQPETEEIPEEETFEPESEIEIPVSYSEPSQETVSNPFDSNKSDVPGFDIF